MTLDKLLSQESHNQPFSIGQRFDLSLDQEIETWEIKGRAGADAGNPEIIVLYSVKIDPATKKFKRRELTADELSRLISGRPDRRAA